MRPNQKIRVLFKRTAFSFYLFSALILFSVQIQTSCKSETKKVKTEIPKGMVVINLSSYGKPFVIFVPDTANAQLVIKEHLSGALHVRVGTKFGISINEQAIDLLLLKQDLASDEVNKFKSYVQEQDSLVFWESEIIKPEFHFSLNRHLANGDYSFEDIRDPETGQFSKEEITKMIEACKSAQAAKEFNS